YHQVPEFLAKTVIEAGGDILLNASVMSIDWVPGAVRIRFQRDSHHLQISASKAIITLPLGVLLAGSVDFSPRLEKQLAAAAMLRMGSVQRTVLKFHEPSWRNGIDGLADHLRQLSFLYSTGSVPPVWWTPFPENHYRLTAWTGGPRANSLPRSQPELEQHLLS